MLVDLVGAFRGIAPVLGRYLLLLLGLEQHVNPLGAARGVLKALVTQEKLSEAEAQVCLGLLQEGRVTISEVTLMSVTTRTTAAQQVAAWLNRPVSALA
ncbi:hypothetical protein MF271_22405 (plasmid) [Deinococcus sp. KNUC1210]|uniref:hypothetical protein n=1 Tax=Deinococcus sp. KNUC1210 TaxID=2917691 RepID=UPI001EF0DC94|nr:hypothetical protein [Deinococcus sp. KNUC1210]ULH18223.1 hypothetical protein MF271_22405 [Deinococcus sp. KNUC1210]